MLLMRVPMVVAMVRVRLVAAMPVFVSVMVVVLCHCVMP